MFSYRERAHLVNVLEFARGPALEVFLKLCDIKPSCPLEDFEFKLHEDSQSPIGPGRTPYLVEIVPGKSELITIGKGRPKTKKPIHDARIIGGSVEVLVEAKIVGTVHKPQRNSYIRKFKLDEGNIRGISWEELHRAFSGLLPDRGSVDDAFLSTGAFLLTQLLEYLEIHGLCSFSGIREEHFDIVQKSFAEKTAQENERLKWLTKSYVNAIKDEIDSFGSKKLVKSTQNQYVGNLKKSEPDPWVSLAEESENTVQFPHYGSSIRGDRVDVYVVCEGKHASSRIIGACRFDLDQVMRSLERLEGYKIRAHWRRKGSGGYRDYQWMNPPLVVAEIPSSSCRENLRQIVDNWSKWWEQGKYPTVVLNKGIPATEVIEAGARFDLRVAEMMREMQPFRDFVHDWRKPAGGGP